MRLKLDVNLGTSLVQRCREAGHDVTTVVDEGLQQADVTGRLWVVREDRVRQYERG